ncbi:endospore germination permease [Bacillus cereus]
MPGKEKNIITLMQYIFIINGTQVGTGVLSLPRIVAEKAGTDGWISIIIGWLCSMLASICFIQVVQKIPHDTSQYFFQRLFGKHIGRIIIILYTLYFLLYYWIVVVNSILFIKGWFLPSTPDYLIFSLLCIQTYMVVQKKLQGVGRYCESMFYMTMWIPIFFFLPLTNGSWLHFLPIFKDGMLPILKAVPTTSFSFLGFEMCIFLYPYLKQKNYALQGVLIANTITMIFYLFTTIICFYFFSPDGISQFTQPVLSILQLVEFRFLERFDLILLSFYLLVVSTSWVSFVYGALLLINPKQKSSLLSYQAIAILLTGILLVAIFHLSWTQSEQYQRILSYIGIGMVYCFSLFLWLYTNFTQIYNRRKACSK